MSWMFSILMCCPGPGTSERSEITKPLAAGEMRPKRNRTKGREADFSRTFNQPPDHMILASISNFQNPCRPGDSKGFADPTTNEKSR